MSYAVRKKRCSGCGARLDRGALACSACGAGLPTLSSASPAVGLAIGWTVTVCTAVLPWLWIREHVEAPVYAGGFLVYVVIANLLTPAVDTNDMGRFGFDDPFRYSDDQNRVLHGLAVALFPGKLVWWTLRLTWRAIGSLG